ncbi:hypothetical protein [Nitrosomonas sp. Nm51]|uniref:hypothetical protein n=1 Tax=Nitrosomonas sp. Nm51 TaxID=133720 RepID=UPI000B8892CC|nr:hypothetical protein [Nitrosomonas sp. Nm51]
MFGIGSIPPNNIRNIRGSEGFSIIAGLGCQLGVQVVIQTEAALNPFVLEGADYSVFNVDGALDRFNPASGASAITD